MHHKMQKATEAVSALKPTFNQGFTLHNLWSLWQIPPVFCIPELFLFDRTDPCTPHRLVSVPLRAGSTGLQTARRGLATNKSHQIEEVKNVENAGFNFQDSETIHINLRYGPSQSPWKAYALETPRSTPSSHRLNTFGCTGQSGDHGQQSSLHLKPYCDALLHYSRTFFPCRIPCVSTPNSAYYHFSMYHLKAMFRKYLSRLAHFERSKRCPDRTSVTGKIETSMVRLSQTEILHGIQFSHLGMRICTRRKLNFLSIIYTPNSMSSNIYLVPSAFQVTQYLM